MFSCRHRITACAGVMGHSTPEHKPGFFYKCDLRYNRYREKYRRPQCQVLPYSTTNRAGHQEFRSDQSRIGACPVRGQRATSANHVKTLIRRVWERAKEKVGGRRLTNWGKNIYKRRRETVGRAQLRGCQTSYPGIATRGCAGCTRSPSSVCWAGRRRTSRGSRCWWYACGRLYANARGALTACYASPALASALFAAALYARHPVSSF